jgi:hypothetical protein
MGESYIYSEGAFMECSVIKGYHLTALDELRGAAHPVMRKWFENHLEWDGKIKIRELDLTSLRWFLRKVWCEDYIGCYSSAEQWKQEYEAIYPDVIVGYKTLTEENIVWNKEGRYSFVSDNGKCHVFLMRA